LPGGCQPDAIVFTCRGVLADALRSVSASVAVFVPRRDHQHAKANDLIKAVRDLFWRTWIVRSGTTTHGSGHGRPLLPELSSRATAHRARRRSLVSRLDRTVWTHASSSPICRVAPPAPSTKMSIARAGSPKITSRRGRWSLRSLVPRRSRWRVAQFDTLRLRLIKIAARVEVLTRQVRLHLPRATPDQAILVLMLSRPMSPSSPAPIPSEQAAVGIAA
jgi:hypothetical protein